MTLPEILVLRHGETAWNRESRYQGALDSPLTERGEAQARALGRILAGLGVSPRTHDARTSDQGRARATARLALGPVGLVPVGDARLREIAMGAWTGMRRADIDRRWPGPPGEGVVAFYARCEGGEGLEAVAARCRAVLGDLARPTVLVTHGLTLRVLCALALGGAPRDGEAVDAPQGSLIRLRDGRLEVLEPGLPDPAPAARTAPAGG